MVKEQGNKNWVSLDAIEGTRTVGDESYQTSSHVVMGLTWTAVNHGRTDTIERHFLV